VGVKRFPTPLRITMSPPLASLGHHCAMQNTRAKKRSPERGLVSRGHAGSMYSGNYAKARITTRCVDKGDNARMLFWCDIDVTLLIDIPSGEIPRRTVAPTKSSPDTTVRQERLYLALRASRLGADQKGAGRKEGRNVTPKPPPRVASPQGITLHERDHT
jgi:hypothetical protein